MKPVKSNNLFSSIYGVKLYVDDIELIISKVDNLAESSQISDDDNIYENIEELNKYKGNNPKLVKLEYRNGYDFITITLSENLASVYCLGGTFLKAGYEIEKLFLKRKKYPLFTYFLNPRIAKNNLLILSIIFIPYYLYKFFYLKQSFEFNNELWFILFWIFLLFISLVNQDYNGKIELKRKHESGFWVKNKDAILLVIISSIISAVITYLTAKK